MGKMEKQGGKKKGWCPFDVVDRYQKKGKLVKKGRTKKDLTFTKGNSGMARGTCTKEAKSLKNVNNLLPPALSETCTKSSLLF